MTRLEAQPEWKRRDVLRQVKEVIDDINAWTLEVNEGEFATGSTARYEYLRIKEIARYLREAMWTVPKLDDDMENQEGE